MYGMELRSRLRGEILRMAAEGGCNFLCGLACANEVAGAEGDGCDAGVSATAVLFAERREIHIGGGFFPWIRSH